MKNKEEFWVSNISNMNVSLSDLNLTIPAKKIVNLLDSKHYYLTKEQLEKSAKDGSLFKKRDKLILRKFGPETQKYHIEVKENAVFASKQRSVVEIQKNRYEELEISDEKFAEENSDLSD